MPKFQKHLIFNEIRPEGDRRFFVDKIALQDWEKGNREAPITLWHPEASYVKKHQDSFELVEISAVFRLIEVPDSVNEYQFKAKI